jgi:probable HAF family extracellular repeat protein
MRRLSCLLVAVVLVACGRATEITEPPTAADASLNDRTASQGVPDHYEIVALPLLSGTQSAADAINSQGVLAGYATLAGNTVQHATLWRDGTIEDLGTLGGPNSGVLWPGLNDWGVAAGVAETADLQPRGEAWSCSAFFPTTTGHICRGFAYRDRQMIKMPTLGGDNSFATEVNDRGLVVGWAETPVVDPTCNYPQVLQFRAAVWDPATNQIHQLRPLHGDSASAATAINEQGQVVGISGKCDIAVGRFSARRAVMWDHGRVTDIGGLGGIAWNTAMALNNEGVVVGFADTTGDQSGAPNFHAFIWTSESGIQDIGTLSGDNLSEALDINDRGQVVGISIGNSGTRAFIWQNGKMTNLQSLLPPGYPDQLESAQGINDQGQITGYMADPSTGQQLTFLATPVWSMARRVGR